MSFYIKPTESDLGDAPYDTIDEAVETALFLLRNEGFEIVDEKGDLYMSARIDNSGNIKIYEAEQVKSNLLIDDIRDARMINADPNTLDIARNFRDGISKLMEKKWDILYLDHDLSSFAPNGDEMTGKDVMEFLAAFPQFLPNKILFVTSNPKGRQNMEAIYEWLQQRYLNNVKNK